MDSILQPGDLEGAREDGEAFGQAVGSRVAAEMSGANRSHAELTAIGSEGVSTILARANSLADSGCERATVTEWTDAAAGAFHRKLEQAALLLRAYESSTGKH